MRECPSIYEHMLHRREEEIKAPVGVCPEGGGGVERRHIPRLDLRDGQPVVPLELVLEALAVTFGEVSCAHYRVDHFDNRPWGSTIEEHTLDSGSPTVIEAVLAAANAALDAREAAK